MIESEALLAPPVRVGQGMRAPDTGTDALIRSTQTNGLLHLATGLLLIAGYTVAVLA